MMLSAKVISAMNLKSALKCIINESDFTEIKTQWVDKMIAEVFTVLLLLSERS